MSAAAASAAAALVGIIRAGAVRGEAPRRDDDRFAPRLGRHRIVGGHGGAQPREIDEQIARFGRPECLGQACRIDGISVDEAAECVGEGFDHVKTFRVSASSAFNLMRAR